MRVQTSISYEDLAKALKLAPGVKIEVIEAHNVTGVLQIVVSGDIPSRCVTHHGFSPSQKFQSQAPDSVYLHTLREGPS